ncbi:meiosis inhibitor protein 1-like [Polyodon spathula]|uniref:meiosis inhibitor protein 1-like n=1 Tax=Polyodon spathula TaxID=7913 RepID=UPI001B7E8A8A|nr:meiosis inhibitor protein 1-like [Polyodon spathula]
MSGVFCERVHLRHDPKWAARFGSPDGAQRLCAACLVEMLEDSGISVVRKKHALSCFKSIMTRFPAEVAELLMQDSRVCVHFVGTLLALLPSAEDASAIEQVIQVLVQLLVELKSELLLHCVLEQCETKVSNKTHEPEILQLLSPASVRRCLPLFTFLGKLLDSLPGVAERLTLEHMPLLQQLSAMLLFPDEGVQASLCFAFGRLYGGGGSAAQDRLSALFRDRLCTGLLTIMSRAQSKELHINCLGFLKQLLRGSEFVSLLMEPPVKEQNNEETEIERNPLPLTLKRLLMSGDETLQIGSSQCMASILVHSPHQYAAPLILADIPEFLFERLSCSNEVLLWSVYSCLLLLTEEKLFFTKCHSVYGIESLVRSVKEAVRLGNPEVLKQGLLLFREVLQRQPEGIKLFSSPASFGEAVETLREGITGSSLEVATEAAWAATALLRVSHLPVPVQYQALQSLVEAVLERCRAAAETASLTQRRATAQPGSEPGSQASRAGAFILSSLETFHRACRLAVDCSLHPSLLLNVFTAPHSHSIDTLESFARFLLSACDTLCIPTVTSLCERAPSASLLLVFYSILNSQYSLVPSMMGQFSAKLASSCFFRLTLELKAAFCAGERNAQLNAVCSEFLCRVSLSLLANQQTAESTQQELGELQGVLQRALPVLICRLSDYPVLLSEDPGGEGAVRDTQHCLLTLLYLAHLHQDRLVAEASLFPAVCTFLICSQERRDTPPAFTLRAALYLLSVSQDYSRELDWSPLNSICSSLCVCPSFSSLYTHHPLVLRFLFWYPKLTDCFGLPALQRWLGQGDWTGPQQNQDQEQDPSYRAVLAVIQDNPSTILVLLGIICTGEAQLSHNALLVLKSYLQGRDPGDLSPFDLLRPRLLQILQRVGIESEGRASEAPGVNRSLALVLELLIVVQVKSSTGREMDSTDFKLLYHVSTLAGKMQSSSTEELQPAFKYLYGSLCACNSGRAVSMLLSNVGLLDLLQSVWELYWARPQSSDSPAHTSLLSSACLLLTALLKSQRAHSAQVYRGFSLSIDQILQLLSSRKKSGSLLLASSLLLLQTLLDQDLSSALLSVGLSERRERPLEAHDSALYPLSSERANWLLIALQNLLIQRQDLLLHSAVGCLGALLGFLTRRNQNTALHVVSQPWTRFLLYTLLNSGEESMLHPAPLSLITLLLKYQSKNVAWEPDLNQIVETAKRRGAGELGESTAQALRELLTQLQSSGPAPPGLKEKEEVQNLLEELEREERRERRGERASSTEGSGRRRLTYLAELLKHRIREDKK